MDAAEFQGLVAESRTYRRYGACPLRRDELLGLVEAARLAPTGNNSQQLRFRVVPGMEDPAGCQLVFSHLHWAASLPDWDGPEADERPGGYVVVCLPHKVAKSPVRLIDVGIAAQTLAFAAAARAWAPVCTRATTPAWAQSSAWRGSASTWRSSCPWASAARRSCWSAQAWAPPRAMA